MSVLNPQTELSRRSIGIGLSARIVFLLTLALLPLGLIAVLQSFQAVQTARDTYRNSLSAQTVRIVKPQTQAIVRAFGQARGLAQAVPALRFDPMGCVRSMKRVAANSPDINFVGFIDTNQVTTCNNMDQQLSFAGNPRSDRAFAARTSDIVFTPKGEASQEPVIVISEPVFTLDEEFLGFVSISFPAQSFAETQTEAALHEALNLLTFDNQGRVLVSDIDEGKINDLLPVDLRLSDLIGQEQRVFAGTGRDGVKRDYALVPILETEAYALGMWAVPTVLQTGDLIVLRGTALPLLMWLASLAVAVFALRRLVIKPVRKLRERMRAFADRRAILALSSKEAASREFREISDTFETMAGQILRDEAELEDRLYERNLLLREVHHRVKNNLQLMSSIINMQIRQSTDDAERDALHRVQARLSSLAKFHQELYETSSLRSLRADQLIEDLVRQILANNETRDRRFDLRLDLDEVILSPDRTSALAMLMTEALSNAVQYAGHPKQGAPVVIGVSVKCSAASGKDRVTVDVENSLPEDAFIETTTGLGSRLIKAFARQLDADLEIGQKTGRFAVHLTFDVEGEA
ncbi:MAG: sensor histidine kinase [Pseudomonadota bacterium]